MRASDAPRIGRRVRRWACCEVRGSTCDRSLKSTRRSGATTGDAVASDVAIGVTRLSARGGRGRATRRAVRRAVSRRRRTPDAHLTRIALVEARGHRRAWATSRRVVDMRGITRACVLRRRADPHVLAAVGRQFAAAETITAVGRDRQAYVEARAGLCCCQLCAVGAAPRNGCVRLIGAVRVSAGRVVRCDRQRIAFVAPIAVVVAGARVRVEVTILAARCVVLARNAAVIRIFGVVTRARAIGIV